MSMQAIEPKEGSVDKYSYLRKQTKIHSTHAVVQPSFHDMPENHTNSLLTPSFFMSTIAFFTSFQAVSFSSFVANTSPCNISPCAKACHSGLPNLTDIFKRVSRLLAACPSPLNMSAKNKCTIAPIAMHAN